MKTHSRRKTRSKHRPPATSSTLDQRIAALIKNHDRLMETTDRAMAASKQALETVNRQLEEARKLKQEIQEKYDRLKELRTSPYWGIV